MSFSFLKPITNILFGSKETETSEENENVKAYFSLEGTNPDGDYVFVSRNELPGRSFLAPDGTFYFIPMENPDDKESLDKGDQRLFFPVKFFVQKEELDKIKQDILAKEEEIDRLLKKKKDLEFQINELHKENERLAAIPRKQQEIPTIGEEKAVQENPVYVETVAEMSGSKLAPKEGMEALEVSRTLFLDYQVTGITTEEEKELADIVTISLAKHVNKSQIGIIVNKFMQGEKTGDAETYLRLAAFVTCLSTITEHVHELANVANRKEINNSLINKCVVVLKERNEDEEYANLSYRERLEQLIEKIEPAKQEYVEIVETYANPQTNASPTL